MMVEDGIADWGVAIGFGGDVGTGTFPAVDTVVGLLVCCVSGKTEWDEEDEWDEEWDEEWDAEELKICFCW